MEKPEAWRREARIARGELCKDCGAYNWPQDREGERPQLCLRCRYKILLAEMVSTVEPTPAPVLKVFQVSRPESPPGAVEGLVEAIQSVLSQGLIDGHSRKRLEQAVAVAGLTSFLNLSEVNHA